MTYIIIALLCYTLAILAMAYANRNSNIIGVNAVISTLSAILPIAILQIQSNKFNELFTKEGLFFSVLAGLFIGVYGIYVGKAYLVNNVGIVAPIVFGGSIFLSTILSYFIFGEKVGAIQSLGLGFIFIGLALIIYTKM